MGGMGPSTDWEEEVPLGTMGGMGQNTDREEENTGCVLLEKYIVDTESKDTTQKYTVASYSPITQCDRK